MGLDFNKSSACWSYSGFNQFREKLAKQIGFDLRKMEGFHEGEDAGIPWSKISDPLVPFLNHSDCDGKLTVEEMKQVSPRLAELVKDWSDDDLDKGHALQLCDDMNNCIEENEELVFC